MYDIFTNPVVGYLRPGFFCVNFMVPGPMTGFIDLGDAVGGNWAENEQFPQIKTLQKTLQSLTTKTVERGGKHHLVEESPRINRIFSEAPLCLLGSQSWYRLSITFWNGIIDGFDLLKAQQIAIPGPLDGHKPPLPICWGALWGAVSRNAKLKGWGWSPIAGWWNQQNLWLEIFGWKIFRFLKSWLFGSNGRHSLTNQCLGEKNLWYW